MKKIVVLFFLYHTVAFPQNDSTLFEKHYAFVEKHRYDVGAKKQIEKLAVFMDKNAKTPLEKGLATFVKIRSDNAHYLSHNMASYMQSLDCKALNYFIEAKNRHYQKLALMNLGNAYEAKYNPDNQTKSAKSVLYGTMAFRFDYDPNFILTEPIYENSKDREVSKSEMKAAITVLEKSYQNAVKFNNIPVQMYRLQKLGVYKFYLNHRFEELESDCLKAINLASQLNNNFKTYILGDLTVYANNAKQYDKAVKYGLWGYIHSRDSLEKIFSRETIFLDQLYRSYKALGDYEKAIFYKEKSIAIVEEKFTKNESKKNELLDELNQELQKNLNQEKRLAESRQKLFWLIGTLILLSLSLVYFFVRNLQLKQKNAEISTAMLQGQTIERKRVAADLHDNLGSTLSSIKWSLEAIDKSKMDKSELEVHQNLSAMLQSAYNEVRLLSHNLLPEEFEKQGLASALEYFVRRINQQKKIKFSLDIAENVGRLDKKVEFELYSICLELANNIIKHSKATEAKIALFKIEGPLKLVVSDNGIGTFKNDSDGKGLKNVQARVDSLGGKWEIQNIHNQGVKNEITIFV